MSKFILFSIFVLTSFSNSAQTFSISGKVLDSQSKTTLPNANVLLVSTLDSTFTRGEITDLEGNFNFNSLPKGIYRIAITYLGYDKQIRITKLFERSSQLGDIFLNPSSILVNEVKVDEKATRTEQKGDTTQYNSNAFKTNTDATMEDLVKKMPGISVENGTLKAHGEEVKKVMIDGKEYFGDDVNTAIKNLPAEVIEKIQVFDKLSDQSQLTGFNDGNTTKTINIITKPGKSNGQFGKVYGGYGFNPWQKGETDNRYQSGLNLNMFSKKRKISIIGQSNNINQQNFSTQDLAGIFGAQSNNPMSGMGGGGRGMGGGGGGRPPGMQNDADNFTVNSLAGITTTHAFGVNYSESFGKKLNVTGSYFFNQNNNLNETELARNYFNNEARSLSYLESNATQKQNVNHRINARITYDLDSFNTFIFTPKLTFQNADNVNIADGMNSLDSAKLNSTIIQNQSKSKAYNYSGDLLYQHKFLRKGRTISVGANTQGNSRDALSSLVSQNSYYEMLDTNFIDINQRITSQSSGNTLGGSLTYTEPIGKKSILELGYVPTVVLNASNKENSRLYPDSLLSEVIDSTLSSKFENLYATHRGRLSYRFKTDKFNFMLGTTYQFAELSGLQTFPITQEVKRNFQNVLPNAMLMVNFSKSTSLRLYYRTSTNAPSLQQLQGVIDNSNPLVLAAGNPLLRQDYSHFLVFRFSHTNAIKATSLFAFLMLNTTSNYIGNNTSIASNDSILPQGLTLNRGARITIPYNMNGYFNLRSFLTYGLPFSFIKSNLNLNLGANYSRSPSIINNKTNFANNQSYVAGFVLSSNVSEKLDFNFGVTGSYYIVKNTILEGSNNNYFNQVSFAKLNWQFWKGFVVTTELNHTLFEGLGSAFNTSFYLWNAGIAYKFLKNQEAEIRLSSFDLLNQNRSISRTVSDTYVENNRSLVLNRFFMITFTYNLRKFKKAKS